MNPNRHVFASLLLIATPPPDLPWPENRTGPEAVAPDLAALAGTWRVVEEVINGHDLSPDTSMAPNYWFVIEDDRCMSILNEGISELTQTYRIAVDPKADPKAFETTHLFQGRRPKHPTSVEDLAKYPNLRQHGIYRIDGDRLITCTGPVRPSEFAAPAGSERRYIVYRRVVPEGPIAHATPSAAAELARLDGTWIAIAANYYGEDAPPEMFQRDFLKFDGGRWTGGQVDDFGHAVLEDGRTAPVAVDPDWSPKAIDFVSYPGVCVRWIEESIYRLDGDILTIASDIERPTDFEVNESPGRAIMIYRRADLKCVYLR